MTDLIVNVSAPWFLLKFGNAADADIDIADLEPGRIIDDAGDRQAEDSLEIGNGLARFFTKNTIGSNCWKGRIGLGDSV